MLFMTILSTDLKALKRRGYNGALSPFPTALNLLSVTDFFLIPH